MNTRLIKSAMALAAIVVAGHAAAQVTFYEGEGFRGRAFAARQSVNDFRGAGFNDRASSVIVTRGRWEVCEDINFSGRCAVLQPGNYDSLRGIGFDNRISSVRPFREGRPYAGNMPPPPPPAPVYEYRRRPEERVREVPVTNVREVLGPPGQRCWTERQQVSQPAPSNGTSVGGAVLGGLVGGILGHQVGKGSGRDAATALGAVGGAVVGNNIGGRNQPDIVSTQDVQRCENTAGAPAYYEVTYNFRGQEHRVQMSTPPGPTILVNGNGDPRM